jgi:hypothetical protein
MGTTDEITKGVKRQSIAGIHPAALKIKNSVSHFKTWTGQYRMHQNGNI